MPYRHILSGNKLLRHIFLIICIILYGLCIFFLLFFYAFVTPLEKNVDKTCILLNFLRKYLIGNKAYVPWKSLWKKRLCSLKFFMKSSLWKKAYALWSFSRKFATEINEEGLAVLSSHLCLTSVSCDHQVSCGVTKPSAVKSLWFFFYKNQIRNMKYTIFIHFHTII